MTPIEMVVRAIARYATHRDGDEPPHPVQRVLVALIIVAVGGIEFFVYGIFAAVGLYLVQITLVGGPAAATAVITAMLGAVVGVLIGIRNALDYWLHYDHA